MTGSKWPFDNIAMGGCLVHNYSFVTLFSVDVEKCNTLLGVVKLFLNFNISCSVYINVSDCRWLLNSLQPLMQ